jgi:hypothetical protein
VGESEAIPNSILGQDRFLGGHDPHSGVRRKV